MKRSVFVCDRCKKELQTPHIVTGRMYDNVGRDFAFEYHFCHDCMKAIGSLIATAPKTEAEEELLPCPFCGGEAESQFIPSFRNSHFVRCKICLSSVRGYDTKDKAIAAWNRRAK